MIAVANVVAKYKLLVLLFYKLNQKMDILSKYHQIL